MKSMLLSIKRYWRKKASSFWAQEIKKKPFFAKVIQGCRFAASACKLKEGFDMFNYNHAKSIFKMIKTKKNKTDRLRYSLTQGWATLLGNSWNLLKKPIFS